jgi:hypothetical protein
LRFSLIATYDHGVPEILPRFYRHMQELEDLKRIGQILLEGGEVERESGLPLRRSADGHNRDRRRGLPMISKGIGGTSPGTNPLAAVLRKEAQGQLWR